MIRYTTDRLIYVVCILLFCLSALCRCRSDWREYTIQEVTQALYDADLISSQDLPFVEYPNGIHEYALRTDTLILPGRYAGNIALYPTRSERERVRRGFAESMAKGPFTYSEFIKGNVVITIRPELSPEDQARFRLALDSLG